MHFLETLLQKHFTDPRKILQIHALLITSGFFLFPKPSNTFAFNCLIQSYLRHGKTLDAPLRLFVQSLSFGAQPNHHTFPSLLKSSSPFSGTAIHAQSLLRGLVLNNFAGCSLIKFYAQMGLFLDAHKVFDEMPHPDLASCNAMLDVLCSCNDMGPASEFFESMGTRNIISWTTIINGFLTNGSYYDAIGLFKRLIHENEKVAGIVNSPNEATLVTVLSACANLDDPHGLAIGIEIHAYIIRHHIHLTGFLGTALIDMYGKHGHLLSCENTFKAIVQNEVCTWNAMMYILACNGEEAKALHMFDKMPSEVAPNHITLVAVLTACSRAGLVDLGLRHFESMVSKHGLTPLMEHYGCVVGLLGRAGLLHKAMDFITKMPFEADESVWGALFEACKLHGNAELKAYVSNKLLSLKPRHGGRYMSLRNIYAQEGRWRDVVKMREDMELVGVKKLAGISYVGFASTTSNNFG